MVQSNFYNAIIFFLSNFIYHLEEKEMKKSLLLVIAFSLANATIQALTSASITPPTNIPKHVSGKLDNLLVFSGNANKELAEKVASCLNTQLGNATVTRFNDGEINIQIHESVRKKRCDYYPINLSMPTTKY